MALSSEVIDSLRTPLLEGLRGLSGPWNRPPDPGASESRAAGPGTPDSETLAEALLTYAAELYRFNEKLGLVEAEPQTFVYAHLLDALAPISVFPAGTSRLFGEKVSLVDVGSGAGLPGIPLALAFPQLSVSLLDRSGRRCGFLRNAVAILGRRDISIVQGDLREASRRYPGAFDVLTSRAFHPLEPKLFGELQGLLGPEGEMLFYKGRRDQTEAENSRLLEALEARGERLPETLIRDVDVPALERERTLLLIRRSA